MSYTVSGRPRQINLQPQSVAEDVLQNLATLLATAKYTVPQYRQFGLSWDFVDKPIELAKTMIVAEIMDAVETYEPRAAVLNITFEQDDLTAKLIPTLEVEINA